MQGSWAKVQGLLPGIRITCRRERDGLHHVVCSRRDGLGVAERTGWSAGIVRDGFP